MTLPASSLITLNNRGVRSVSAFGSIHTGSMVFIKKLTASSSATLSFVNGSSDVVLDSTYKEYVFTFKDIHPGTNDADTLMLASSDTGSTYDKVATGSFFQSFNQESDGGSGVGYLTSKDIQEGTGGVPLDHSVGNDNDQSSAGFIHLFNPSSTTFIKHYQARFNIYHAVDNSQDIYAGGYFNTTSAIDAIQFKKDTGTIDAGDICLYGIL